MYRLVVNYHHPADPDAFMEHYRSVHAPLAKRMPGLVSYTYGRCESLDGSKPEFFLTATLDWPSKEDAQAALASPAGQEGTADLANFAQAGVSIVTYEAETVV
ncbi:MAG TPA: EthD family reductase [Pseudonocardia sp.]|jgi:uncharacterized protein (TIGR02118 family)|uniref:EthD family reductase n=1 Tax=Pseudonocardia sp. TaxID=60912 RepID=UPI002B4B7D40|nr:EthD family reductase [Pseudonocardia sp.]HLU57782.1 EthD family reductase [Pseudonocardia sp.]